MTTFRTSRPMIRMHHGGWSRYGYGFRGFGDAASDGTMTATTDPTTPVSSTPTISLNRNPIMWAIEAASVGASAFHGYRRNNSVGWAIWWGFMGALFPIITPAIALAQGFGKRAGR
jgi:hypothetical protein